MIGRDTTERPGVDRAMAWAGWPRPAGCGAPAGTIAERRQRPSTRRFAVSLSTDRPVAVVTGASSGIGRATARQLVEAGWQAIGVGRDPDRIAQATREIEAAVVA